MWEMLTMSIVPRCIDLTNQGLLAGDGNGEICKTKECLELQRAYIANLDGLH